MAWIKICLALVNALFPGLVSALYVFTGCLLCLFQQMNVILCFFTSPLLNLCHLQMTQQLAQSSSCSVPVNESIHSKEPAKMKFWNQGHYMQARHTVPPFPIKSPFAKFCKSNRNDPNLHETSLGPGLIGASWHSASGTFEMTKTCLSGFPHCSVRTHFCL